MSMRTEKERLLVATYNAMPTTEIQRRLNSGQLTLIATEIAQTILKSRFGAAINEPSLNPDDRSRARLSGKRRNWTPLRLVGALLILGLITGLLAFPLQSGGPFFMVIFLLVLPGIAAVIGKSFRTLGLSVGWALVSTPFWLGVYLWHTGAFIFKGGDFNPLGALVAYFFYFLVSVIAIALGGGFITGAKHEGAWSNLADELDDKRKKSMDSIQKLD